MKIKILALLFALPLVANAAVPCKSLTFKPLIPLGKTRKTPTPTPTPVSGVDPNCYTFIVPESDTYGLWHRVYAPNSNADSFFVSVNGGLEFIDDACERRWPCDGVKWSPLTQRAPDGTVSTAPFMVTLTKGDVFTVRFSVREVGAQVLEMGIGTPPLDQQQPLNP